MMHGRLVKGLLLFGMGAVAAQTADAMASRFSYTAIVSRASIIGQTTDGMPYANTIAEQIDAAVLKGEFNECRLGSGSGSGSVGTVQTFTVAGFVGSDGQLSNVRFRPSDRMVSCFASRVEQLHLPKPPRGVKGVQWPVAIEYDSTNGSVLDVSDAYRAKGISRPLIPPPPPSASYPVPIYTPSPSALEGLGAVCKVVIGTMVDAKGAPHNPVVRKSCGVPEADSEALDAARQWVFFYSTAHPVARRFFIAIQFMPGG